MLAISMMLTFAAILLGLLYFLYKNPQYTSEWSEDKHCKNTNGSKKQASRSSN